MGRTIDRHQLRQALVRRHPWLARTDMGPRAVEAGECDRCGHEARLVMTCGPLPYRYLGRRCALRLGEEAWCEGHAPEGRAAQEWLRGLPEEADDLARLWWVATGEVQLDPALVHRSSNLAEVVAGVLER